jgi:hypothetical protein
LTGKSERTIRRFLQKHVVDSPNHFRQKTNGGRDVWLIETDFLRQHYAFEAANESLAKVAGGTDTDMARDNKGLTKKWQQSKQDRAGTVEGAAGESQVDHDSGAGAVTDTPVKKQTQPADSLNVDELWALVKHQQETIEKKDEQLDRYFTEQAGHLKTMGRLVEQNNLLTARAQGEAIGTSSNEVFKQTVVANAEEGGESANASIEVDADDQKEVSQDDEVVVASVSSAGSEKRAWWRVF